MAPKKVFAIIKGRVDQPTILTSEWETVTSLVTNFPDNKYEGFPTVTKAEEWMRVNGVYDYVVDGAVPRANETDWRSSVDKEIADLVADTKVSPADLEEGERPDDTAQTSKEEGGGTGTGHSDRYRNQKAPAQLTLKVDFWDQKKLFEVLDSLKI